MKNLIHWLKSHARGIMTLLVVGVIIWLVGRWLMGIEWEWAKRSATQLTVGEIFILVMLHALIKREESK